MTNEQAKNWQKEFDERFGKIREDFDFENDIPELSIGRKAGCDDCEENQKIRLEHKDFISKLLEEQRKEAYETGMIEGYDKGVRSPDHSKQIRKEVLDEVKKALPKYKTPEANPSWRDVDIERAMTYDACLEEVKDIINKIRV